jgi:hypothetical protein
VLDVEFFEPLTAGQADGDAVAAAADVHGNVKLGATNMGPPYVIEIRGKHPLVSSTYRATTKPLHTIPDDMHG